MWGFWVGICGTNNSNENPATEKWQGLLNTWFSRAFFAYIKPSSIALLTAARRLLTPSLL